jgi:hypothetical protein
MVWARLCFYYFHSLILTQFSYHASYIRFYLPIYNRSAVFWCKNYVILTVPPCMRQAVCFFLNIDIPPSVLSDVVGKPSPIVSLEVYHFYS